MATYIGIKGIEIQTIAGDPANPIAGQVWYNTTANTLKGYGMQGTAAWASGGDINTPRKYPGSNGLVTAAWFAGGDSPGPTVKDEAETYDGSSWSEVAKLQTARGYMGGAGNSAAALTFGGWIPPAAPNVQDLTESWNGTSWSEVNALLLSRRRGMGQGTQAAALYIGGKRNGGAPTQTGVVESWNGTCWTELADLGTARYDAGISSQGTPSSSVIAGGGTGTTPPGAGYNLICETWNGTSWTEVNNLTTGKVQGNGAGVETFALVWGGASPPWYSCEEWNGTCWTEVADSAVNAYGTGHGGTARTAWQASGMSPAGPFPDGTEEWATPDATKTFTSS